LGNHIRLARPLHRSITVHPIACWLLIVKGPLILTFTPLLLIIIIFLLIAILVIVVVVVVVC
jgi:hypothetical protein